MKLIMNDGQQLPIQSATESGGVLRIRMINQTSAGLKTIFQDALAVEVMTVQESGKADRVYSQYTELVRISEYTGGIWEVETRQVEATTERRLAELESRQELADAALQELILSTMEGGE